MKKVNFFNFPSISINVDSDKRTTQKVSSAKRKSTIKI